MKAGKKSLSRNYPVFDVPASSASAVNAFEVVRIICFIVDNTIEEGLAFERLAVHAEVRVACTVVH